MTLSLLRKLPNKNCWNFFAAIAKMKCFILLNVFIGFLGDAVFGRPTVQPPFLYVCPNETITQPLICNDSYSYALEWELQPYTGLEDGLVYIPSLLSEDRDTRNRSDILFSELLVLDGIEGIYASITISLRVNTTIIDKMLNISCSSSLITTTYYSYIVLYVAGVPHPKNISIAYEKRTHYFTAVLELGDMFDGGGVPIDHYIIQVDNGTQLETAGPTYNFDIMYNTTLSVNISAHNCAGYSDPFPLEIEYEQDNHMSSVHSSNTTAAASMTGLTATNIIRTTMMPMPTNLATPTLQTTPQSLIIIAGVAIASVLLITFTGLLMLFTCLFYRKHRKRNESQQEMKCGVIENPAYDVVHVQGSAGDGLESDYNMENNPLYEMRIKSNERHSHKTETAAGAGVYENVDNASL